MDQYSALNAATSLIKSFESPIDRRQRELQNKNKKKNNSKASAYDQEAAPTFSEHSSKTIEEERRSGDDRRIQQQALFKRGDPRNKRDRRKSASIICKV